MKTLEKILTDLIQFPSVTPHDHGCQEYMIAYLEDLGFTCQRFNQSPVSNFFARFGDKKPLTVFAGHTDVVAPGDKNSWNSDPFQLIKKDEFYYGRGVADMKGSLACMLETARHYVEQYTSDSGSLGFLITSGEEGDHYHLGTPYVMEQLTAQGVHIDFCIVGEPSSHQSVGDVIKIGRRGSLNAIVRLYGKQGHVAYPHLASNPIHTLAPALLELSSTVLDNGNAHFPPTSLQITHIHAGDNGHNVIPGECAFHFNIRYSNEHNVTSLQDLIMACFARHHLEPSIEWRLSGEPFLTPHGQLLESVTSAIITITNQTPALSTNGGTSDGRFIAPYGVEVIELGLTNDTIHQTNERVPIQDLEKLMRIYDEIFIKMV